MLSNGIADHHCRKGAKRDAIARISCRHELTLRSLPNQWQSVVAFDYLSRPSTINLGGGQKTMQHRFQFFEERLGFRRLPSLMIETAEDDIGLFFLRIDPQIVVGFTGIPERSFRHAFFG